MEDKKGSKILEQRQLANFVPYFKERDELGNLLRNYNYIDKSVIKSWDPETKEPTQSNEELNESRTFSPPTNVNKNLDVPDTASKCSTDSQKERFV